MKQYAFEHSKNINTKQYNRTCGPEKGEIISTYPQYKKYMQSDLYE